MYLPILAKLRFVTISSIHIQDIHPRPCSFSATNHLPTAKHSKDEHEASSLATICHEAFHESPNQHGNPFHLSLASKLSSKPPRSKRSCSWLQLAWNMTLYGRGNCRPACKPAFKRLRPSIYREPHLRWEYRTANKSHKGPRKKLSTHTGWAKV